MNGACTGACLKKKMLSTLQEGQEIVEVLKNYNRKLNIGTIAYKQHQMVNIHNFRCLCLFKVGYGSVTLLPQMECPRTERNIVILFSIQKFKRVQFWNLEVERTLIHL